MKLEYRSVAYEAIDASKLDIKYIDDLLHDACIWSPMREYLTNTSQHEKDKNKTGENRHLDYFCDADAYVMCLLLLKRESSVVRMKPYSWTELSGKMFCKSDVRRVKKIVEAGVHFDLLKLKYDDNNRSLVSPTDELRSCFRKYIYPNIRYC